MNTGRWDEYRRLHAAREGRTGGSGSEGIHQISVAGGNNSAEQLKNTQVN
jgi:hypothetical protein